MIYINNSDLHRNLLCDFYLEHNQNLKQEWVSKGIQILDHSTLFTCIFIYIFIITNWLNDYCVIHSTRYYWLYLLAYPSEKAMAPHSSTLTWKIPWTEEPGGLQSMESLRVGHDWATSLSLFTFMHWKRKWQPTPVFLPGESQGQGRLVGCRLWGRTELDTTEAT